MEYADSGAGVGPAGLLKPDIPNEACYAVRIDSPEVCAQQRCSGGMGIFVGAADPPEDFGRK